MADDYTIPQPNSVDKRSNLYSQNKFKVVIDRFPTMNFFAQIITLPSISVGAVRRGTNTMYDYPVPGDKINYEMLTIIFLLDEQLKGYRELKSWMEEFHKELIMKNNLSDIRIIPLTNNSNYNNIELAFKNCFPTTISPLALDVTDTSGNPMTVDVTFEFSNYDIKPDYE